MVNGTAIVLDSTSKSRDWTYTFGLLGIICASVVLMRWAIYSYFAYLHYRTAYLEQKGGRKQKSRSECNWDECLTCMDPGVMYTADGWAHWFVWGFFRFILCATEYFCMVFVVAVGWGVFFDLFVTNKVLTANDFDQTDAISFFSVTMFASSRLRAIHYAGDEDLEWYSAQNKSSGVATNPTIDNHSWRMAHVYLMGGTYDNVYLFHTMFGQLRWAVATGFAVVAIGSSDLSSGPVSRFFAAMFGGGIGLMVGIVVMSFFLTFAVKFQYTEKDDKRNPINHAIRNAILIPRMLMTTCVACAGFMGVVVIYIGSLMMSDRTWYDITSMSSDDRKKLWGYGVGLGIGFVLVFQGLVSTFEVCMGKKTKGYSRKYNAVQSSDEY